MNLTVTKTIYSFNIPILIVLFVNSELRLIPLEVNGILQKKKIQFVYKYQIPIQLAIINSR